MNEYLKQYIELQKQFRETEGDPDSVRALYTFKEKLELSEDKQAKEVLVDVYDLLDFKKDAYELLCQIGNRSDKKTLKRLGVLKDYAENWGNHYAIPKPQTPEEKQNEKERRAQLGLPAFRYHPYPLETGAFEESADGVVCDCCGKTTHVFYTNPFFSVEDIAYLCPECIASGEAVRKYDGSFQDDFSLDDGVDDPEKLDELIHRPPRLLRLAAGILACSLRRLLCLFGLCGCQRTAGTGCAGGGAGRSHVGRGAERYDPGIRQWRAPAMLSVPVPPLRKAPGLDGF